MDQLWIRYVINISEVPAKGKAGGVFVGVRVEAVTSSALTTSRINPFTFEALLSNLTNGGQFLSPKYFIHLYSCQENKVGITDIVGFAIPSLSTVTNFLIQ